MSKQFTCSYADMAGWFLLFVGLAFFIQACTPDDASYDAKAVRVFSIELNCVRGIGAAGSLDVCSLRPSVLLKRHCIPISNRVLARERTNP